METTGAVFRNHAALSEMFYHLHIFVEDIKIQGRIKKGGGGLCWGHSPLTHRVKIGF